MKHCTHSLMRISPQTVVSQVAKSAYGGGGGAGPANCCVAAGLVITHSTSRVNLPLHLSCHPLNFSYHTYSDLHYLGPNHHRCPNPPKPPWAELHRVTDISATAGAKQMVPSFKAGTLQPLDSHVSDSFRVYFLGISRFVDFSGNVIGYTAPRSLPVKHGHAMRNEADHRTFTNSLYVDPAKGVMLEMLPGAPHRSYD